MTVEGIETMAMDGLPMPGGLDLADQLLFLGFRHLYAAAALGRVTGEQGSREKRGLLEEHRKAKAVLAESQQAINHHAKLWKAIEEAGNVFGRERTVESGEAFYKAVYGVGLLPVGGRMPKNGP